ncbi:MAG: MATE family efflux transporter [Cyanobacteria bacterium J06631_12]
MSTDFASRLPALKLNKAGKPSVDYRQIVVLALPLFLDSFTYIVIGLTDTWFISRISTDATAAVGAINWLMFVFIMLFACIGVAVQTKVAQAYGANKLAKAARLTWTGLWVALLTFPMYGAIALSGPFLLAPFGLDEHIEQLALLYWLPRMLGGAIVVADWTLRGFFNAINRTHLALIVSSLVCVLNIGFNALFIFSFNWGVAGAAWAAVAAQSAGLILQLFLFLRPKMRQSFRTDRTWKPRASLAGQLINMGIFSGLFMVSDIVGLAFFQMMQTQLGVAPGAATQIAITLLSLSYQPVVGVGEAGIILVGQSLGAGSRSWAKQVGNAVIRLSICYMVVVGVLLAIAGNWAILPFVKSSAPDAAQVVSMASSFLWIAALYQFFHALTIASTFCLQGEEDVRFPAVLTIFLSLFVFVPVAHMLSFNAGEGFLSGLPSFGHGAFGGWWAYAGYLAILGSILWGRWRTIK